MIENNVRWNFKVQNKNIILAVNDKVFLPSITSFFLALNLKVFSGESVYDVGTGSGFLAIMASLLGAQKVFASETDHESIITAKKNFYLNGVSNIQLVNKEYFDESLQEKFDVILANLPQFPCPPQNPEIERYTPTGTVSGIYGNEHVTKFLTKSKNKIKKGGRIYVPLVYASNPQDTLKVIKNHYKARVIATQNIPFGHLQYAIFDYLFKLKENGFSDFFNKDGFWFFKEELLELTLTNNN